MRLREKKWIRVRIYVVSGFFLACLCVIWGRSIQLQIVERQRLAAIAREGYLGTTKLPPKRGAIYDRHGHELALSVEVGSIYAHPKRVENKVQTAEELNRILGVNRKDLLRSLKSDRSFVWIKRRVDPNKVAEVEALDRKGIGSIAETRRYYIGRELAAQLLGFVGTDNQGLEGLERQYDAYLRGPAYSLIHMRDAKGRPFAVGRPVSSGQEMHDLVLTIDKNIQYKCQRALRNAVGETGAKSGQCLVVAPRTGEILAMAVVPDFNPNAFNRYPSHTWRNRIVTDVFEPGSTMKAFLVSAALDQGAVSPETSFDCEHGRFPIGGHVIHDTHEHDILTVSEIVTHSSNIGAIKVGRKLGYPDYCRYLKTFGFGRPAEAGIAGERSGFIRPPGKARPIEQATMYFGQGMTVTSLQLAMAMCAIANGGLLMRPYVVKEIRDSTGKVVKARHPSIVRRVISGRTAAAITRILEGVVSGEGTAPRAAIEGFQAAGKTGTSQKVDPETRAYSKDKFVGSFVGFVPARDARLVIVVVLDEPEGTGYGGIVAAPVFREVGQWSLNHMQLNPRTTAGGHGTGTPQGLVLLHDLDTLESAAGSPVSREVARVAAELRKGGIPDFMGMPMREALAKAADLGLHLVPQGSGFAVSQNPLPGDPVEEAARVRVRFSPPS